MGCGGGKMAPTATPERQRKMQQIEDASGMKRGTLLIWHEVFHKVAPNGEMTKFQFTRLYMILHEQETNPRLEGFLGKLFVAFDDDLSGTMDFDEFLNLLELVFSGTLEQRLRGVFHLCDADRGGSIEKDELVEACRTAGCFIPGNAGVKDIVLIDLALKAFDELDKDGDGSITLTEFLLGFAQSEEGTQVISFLFMGIKRVVLLSPPIPKE